MSLSVFPYRRTGPGTLEYLEVEATAGNPSLFGFERCRTSLWGAPCVEELGAVLLPRLAKRDIYAEGPDLEVLRKEAEHLLANRSSIAAATGYAEDFIEFRLGNLLLAIQLAASVEGGVGGVNIG